MNVSRCAGALLTVASLAVSFVLASPARADESAPEPTRLVASAEPSPAIASAPPERAAAEADYVTQILAPTEGAEVPEGWIPYTVQFATPGTYRLTIFCSGQTYEFINIQVSSGGDQLSGRMGWGFEGDGCHLDLEPLANGATGSDYRHFTIIAPVPTLEDVVAGPRTFYPTVRDGYRDSVNIAFDARTESDITMEIVSRKTGRVVRTFTEARDEEMEELVRYEMSWGGRDESGRVVPVGRYTAVITSTMRDLSATTQVPLRVASGYRTEQKTKRADGWDDSRDSTRGDCDTTEVPDGNDLDCRGGRYAQAAYRFRLPSNARDVIWRVRGYRECCASPGRITKNGQRISPTAFKVTVRVTGWRSFVVRSTAVTYTIRERI